jgi:RNA polymerase sigma-70 factor, ECF subfamily
VAGDGALLDTADQRAASYQPGSTADFDRLYRACYPRLVRTLYAVLGDAAAAEDCTQEAFVRAFRAWPRFRPERPAEAWMHQIALNVAISYRRRMRLRQAGELIRRLGRPGPGPDPVAEAERSDLTAALARLKPQQSAAIVLRYYHGYTNRELARALGISERTVGQRLTDARTELRRMLGSAWGEVSPLPTRPGSGVVSSAMASPRGRNG